MTTIDTTSILPLLSYYYILYIEYIEHWDIKNNLFYI